ncbi:hypothetical protein ACFE04_002416 [Oxalis oulophora]
MNPCNNVSRRGKTAEIISRYRPIAPKPTHDDDDHDNSKINQSPYLRKVWPQLQAMPTRTRKRGRGFEFDPRKAPQPTLIKYPRRTYNNSLLATPNFLPMQGFASPADQLQFQVQIPISLPTLTCGFQTPATTTLSSVVTIPYLAYTPRVPIVADQPIAAEVPKEKNLLQQLQKPITTSKTAIKPHPIRPIASTVSITRIIEQFPDSTFDDQNKTTDEIEEEIELDTLPAIISDSNNKVRIANSAYKEMVGQLPACSWLDDGVGFGGKKLVRAEGSSSKRINGEVILKFCDSTMPTLPDRFSCWVRIEWGNDEKKICVSAFCDVMKMCCKAENENCLFTWRFHREAATRFDDING